MQEWESGKRQISASMIFAALPAFCKGLCCPDCAAPPEKKMRKKTGEQQFGCPILQVNQLMENHRTFPAVIPGMPFATQTVQQSAIHLPVSAAPLLKKFEKRQGSGKAAIMAFYSCSVDFLRVKYPY